jgi:Ca2+-binding RTX toxin-like protein
VGAGSDTLTGLENLTGSSFSDLLTGDAGANVLSGGRRHAGGGGTTRRRYGSAALGRDGEPGGCRAQNTVGAGSDTLTGIENLTGSSFNDVLTGDAGQHVLSGGAGDDTLDGGAATTRWTAGRHDTASYGSRGSGVTVSLAVAGPRHGGRGSDTLTGLENLTARRSTTC